MARLKWTVSCGRPVLFLDFDGVLGPVFFDPHARRTRLRLDKDLPVPVSEVEHRACWARVRRVVDATGCAIVLSTAWRPIDTLTESVNPTVTTPSTRVRPG